MIRLHRLLNLLHQVDRQPVQIDLATVGGRDSALIYLQRTMISSRKRYE